jgi:hypothetical protein
VSEPYSVFSSECDRVFSKSEAAFTSGTVDIVIARGAEFSRKRIGHKHSYPIHAGQICKFLISPQGLGTGVLACHDSGLPK